MIGSRFVIVAALCLTACAPHTPRPNIVLITVDTLRADHLGCYGYTRPTSPHIDRLAMEGALFERAFTTLPRTTQAVASIVTGRYPKTHGARGLFSSLAPVNLTLAEILKNEGYDTAAFVSNLFLKPGQGFEQGFDRYDNPPERWDSDSARPITTEAIQWLASRSRGRPYFLWVHYLDPHWTYRPDPPFDTKFDPDFNGPFTLYDDLDARRLTKGQVIFENRLTPRQVEHVRALYDGEIAQVDAALGRLLDALAEPGAPPPLVVFTADHGESLGEHGYYFAHGEYLYQETLHVPLIIRFPGRVAAGTRIDALAENVDIAPTIVALLGIERLQSVDGRPLLIAGGSGGGGDGGEYAAAPGRRTVFAESDYQLIHPENRRFYIPGPSGKWSSAFDGRFKLIHVPRPGGDIEELYDLIDDPGETRDLVGGGADSTARPRLFGELERFVDYGSAPPVSPDDLDPEQRQRLRSLGYVN